MKTRNIIVILSSLLLVIISLSFNVLSEENEKTIYVDDDGDKDYTTITEALLNASDGDTIYVYSGTYYESIQINKSISLIGENRDTTTISGLNTQNSTSLVNILADKVKISGFTIKNSTKLEQMPVIEGSDEMWINVGVGLMISSNNNTISNNVITGNGADGILFVSGENTNILNNEITNNSRGIYLQNCSNNKIVNNSISHNSIGAVFLGDAYENIFYYNNFIANIQYHTSDNGNNIFYSKELLHGNYWDDYNGTDKDNDAIGDTPYTILGGANQDPYPLMSPYVGGLISPGFYVDPDLVIHYLWIAMIVTIIFSGIIAYVWYRKTRHLR
jgi:parallel beta-helix repeat protein